MTSSPQHRNSILGISRPLWPTLALAVVLVLTVAAIPSAQAQTFTVLYQFTGGADGRSPHAGLLQDLAGNLYSTTFSGGDLNCAPLTAAEPYSSWMLPATKPCCIVSLMRGTGNYPPRV